MCSIKCLAITVPCFLFTNHHLFQARYLQKADDHRRRSIIDLQAANDRLRLLEERFLPTRQEGGDGANVENVEEVVRYLFISSNDDNH